MNLELITVNDTRDMRFGEILIVKQTGLDIYNTTGLNDCPEELWNALDFDEIKKQFEAMSVQKNGPHYWMMDQQSLMLGDKYTFGGIDARWAAHADPTMLQKGSSGAQPYKIFTPQKTQKMTYSKGKPVFELVDPDGNVYVLQAHNEEFPIESLATLGDKMEQIPKGWQYRSRILDEDLTLDLGPEKTIFAVGDEFRQYYTRI